MKILVADDEEGIRDLMIETLEVGLDCEIQSAENGIDIEELSNKEQYDLILSDFMMPGFNAAEYVKHLRDSDGPNRAVPLIIITGYMPKAKKAMEGFKDVYLMDKFLIHDKLVSKVEDIMEKYK